MESLSLGTLIHANFALIQLAEIGDSVSRLGLGVEFSLLRSSCSCAARELVSVRMRGRLERRPVRAQSVPNQKTGPIELAKAHFMKCCNRAESEFGNADSR